MRSRNFAIAFLIAIFSATAPAWASGEILRCGNRLVQSGDPRDMVRQRCGDPVDVSRQSILRRASFVRNGRTYFVGEEMVEIPVEIWTYNFGPNKFMRRLRFVDGLLEDIESLGYGYNDDK